jgi:bile acid:Na+ symporter, BASS family
MSSTPKDYYKYFYIAAIVFLIAYIYIVAQSHGPSAGWPLLLFFISLAFAFRGSKALSGLAFTMVIFGTVGLSLYHPEYFLQWGDYKLSGLITPLIQLIMFGMGTSMSLKDFGAVIKTPKGVIIGVLAQFIIMPAMGFTLASISGNFSESLTPEIAAGIILIGCSPSGLASNVMCYLAKANLALSLTVTSITTLLAPFVTPLLMKLLAGSLVEIDVLDMMWDISKMIIIPIGAGLIFNKLLSGKIAWLDRSMPLVSMFGIALILTIITAAGRDSLLTIGPILIIVVLIHNSFGYTLGYWSGRLFKLPESDCRTIAIEVGMQNAGLASGIAKEMGKIATLGLAPAVFGPLMNITGSMLASWWHGRQPEGEQPEEVEFKRH